VLGSWKLCLLVYILFGGVWGILAKCAVDRLGPHTAGSLASLTASLVLLAFSWRFLDFRSQVGVAFAVGAGALGAVLILTFYAMLRLSEASVAIPLSSLYIALTVLLAWLFLGEPLGLRKVLGVLCACLSLYLLAG